MYLGGVLVLGVVSVVTKNLHNKNCYLYHDYVIVITQDEYDILVITGVEAKLRMSDNNKDIIRMYLGYNWLIAQKTLPINAFFV